jgi:hypothetical protein
MSQQMQHLNVKELEKLMTAMAGSQESHGERQPGEKCAYEIYRKELQDNPQIEWPDSDTLTIPAEVGEKDIFLDL